MRPYRVTRRIQQTADTATLELTPVSAAAPRFRAGQFMMLYRFGVGEIAISISGDPTATGDLLEHTIRSVGAVSAALHDATVGATIGVRGPFGTGWEPGTATGRDLVIIGGGVGLAPLRPVVLEALARRTEYRRVVVITGARTPHDILFHDDQLAWRRGGLLELHQTVDHPAPGWTGPIGFVTEPLAKLSVDPANTTAFLCGPEPMMRFCANTLLRKGVPPTDIRVSLERNMQCGVARCGHCQLGPLLVCRDGPVVDYSVAEPLLSVREL
ncbi:FAD/NAD(P)-binding protein [Nocardia seriolae]|nr:FAD/NAD(P)-binding protein [Nocardia seriolae]MTJ64113.1 oxidoreductase [Nocardia seriolae]MTJ73634.1 oxidoreductase [Nocardia seriolae]MTJ88107.1 oxidoreductase [Nocardia seriolae]MTK32097.1 oxidoreductase [Nocardia seriolae]MTK41999.1 oxidoreductase [Nocardia seriolae]